MEPEVEMVLRAVPEFVPQVLRLVASADGDPGGPAAFGELADYVAGLVSEIERSRPVLARAMAGVELVAASSEEAEELVGWAFLDSLSPDDLRRLDPWMGPATRRLLDALELPPDALELPSDPSAPGP